ncbi:phosphohistidine phosphatase [Roseibium sp. TrichSKD4]|uniref:SixA phosphatase family protein n=1 Tax=Roseibium sp. TrichSKD4 TaxID=744980 RepID=UPI0001E57443|nr:histidine phosphatase family protein [Roseibium sp. TrichSKD4]EFO30789.1 phosphohistidine phosphatase [Roseibium sp. TrichSKD4]
MPRLILYRHAKSDWNFPELTDKQRPLNSRGQKAAPEMAWYLTDQNLFPNLILCSSSQRTRETLIPVLALMTQETEIRLLDQVYDDGDFDYLELIRTHGGTAETLMVIGHNPATEISAQSFVKDGSGPQWDDMRTKYPSGAIAVIDFKISSWADLALETGQFVSFTKPRDLMS